MSSDLKYQIELAIKAQKWVKSDYAYAIGAMDCYSVYSLYYESCLKVDIVNRFWELAENNFYKIHSLTTFKNI